MENKIEFNWEKYQSGEYDCITRDGRKVEQLHWIDDAFYQICGKIDGISESWSINGVYINGVFNSRIDISNSDLFLIPKEKENHFPHVGKMVIPELKGVLMEVSDDVDFKEFVKRDVIGKYNDMYITIYGFYKYARPIKEVKEVWLNIFEDNGKLIVGQSHFDSKEEAIKFKSNNVKYIKTIRITDEPDGETN